MNPFQLFDPSYLIDVRPGSTFMLFWPMVLIMVAVFAGSFKVKISNVAARMREFAVLGLLWAFFRDQNIPYLGMRLWMVLLILAALAYGVWFWKKADKKSEEKPLIDHRRQTVEKYLPKKKRRK